MEIARIGSLRMVACSWMSAPVPLPAPKPSCLSHLDVFSHVFFGGMWRVPSPLTWAQVRYAIYTNIYQTLNLSHVCVHVVDFLMVNARKLYKTRWWFQMFFLMFIPKIGEIIQFDEHICSKVLKPPTRFPSGQK